MTAPSASVGEVTGGHASAAPKPVTHRAKRGKGPKNIFAEWGMDSDARAMKKVEIGTMPRDEEGREGRRVIIERSDASRFWQSDKCLSRFQTILEQKRRETRVLNGIRARYHEDINADLADLTQNHGSFRRNQRGRSLAPVEEGRPSATQEMKELRQKLQPKHTPKPKRVAFGSMDFTGLLGGYKADGGGPGAGGLGLGMGSFSAAKSAMDVAEATAALGRLLEWLYTKHGSLDAAFTAIDANGDGDVCLREFTRACASMGYRNDAGCLMQVLDKSSDGFISRAEFNNLAPYMPKTSPMVSSRRCSEPDEDHEVSRPSRLASPQSQQARLSRAASPPEVPMSASLLVFLNADAHHAGAPVLIKRWPPASLADVLRTCEAAMQPLVGPPIALVGRDLRPVRAVEDLVPGGAYVFRGQEALDPPKAFVHLASTSGDESHGASLHAITRKSHAMAAERAAGGLPAAALRGFPAAASDADSVFPEPPPPVGGPPRRGARGAAFPLPPQGEKWRPDPELAAYMTHGGLGQLPQHHHYHSWPRALASTSHKKSRSLPSLH